MHASADVPTGKPGPWPLVNTGSDARLWGDGLEVETLIRVRAARAGLTVVHHLAMTTMPDSQLP
jgi:hypothetical protein